MLPIASSFTTAPGPGLLLWTAIVAVLFAAAIVTALKGRWGWFVVGVLTGGLGFLIGAALPARPGSVWARRREHTASSPAEHPPHA